MTSAVPAPSGVAGCPKKMIYGPCGGVAPDGGCEVADHPCVFLGRSLPRWPPDERSDPWPTRTAGAAAMGDRLATGTMVIADFPARALDVDSLIACASVLIGNVDAVLVGDSPSSRVQFPPAYRAQLIQRIGLPVWAGLNCRDRNRVALEGEVAALAAMSVAGVHCVTGDHTDTGHRPDAAPVFDLDSARLAALARSQGHLVSVAESPATPPIEARPHRLAEKVKAGADVCFVNHCGSAEVVDDFICAVDAGSRPGAFIACVPVIVDRGSAELLQSFPSLVFPAGYLDRILAAADPCSEGIRAAVELSQQMLSVPSVRGVNLSGGPRHGGEMHFATALAEIGAALHSAAPDNS